MGNKSTILLTDTIEQLNKIKADELIKKSVAISERLNTNNQRKQKMENITRETKPAELSDKKVSEIIDLITSFLTKEYINNISLTEDEINKLNEEYLKTKDKNPEEILNYMIKPLIIERVKNAVKEKSIELGIDKDNPKFIEKLNICIADIFDNIEINNANDIVKFVPEEHETIEGYRREIGLDYFQRGLVIPDYNNYVKRLIKEKVKENDLLNKAEKVVGISTAIYLTYRAVQFFID